MSGFPHWLCLCDPTYSIRRLTEAMSPHKFSISLAAVVSLSMGLGIHLSAQTETKWEPSGGSDGLWTTAGNWSGAAAPLTASQSLHVKFSDSAQEAALDTTATVYRLELGASADNQVETALRLTNGADLTSGLDSAGSVVSWTAIGYSGDARLTVESGASLTAADHLWIGFNPTSTGTLILDGGSVSVSGQLGLGRPEAEPGDGFGTGIIELKSGTLSLAKIFTNDAILGDSYINIEDGLMTIDGNELSDANGYIASGRIRGYGGDSPVLSVYDSNAGVTKVATIPLGFDVAPYATGETSISMTGGVVDSAFQNVEYYFAETSGNSGGDDSGWISSATYTDTGLTPGVEYTYTVQSRIAVDNTSTVSAGASASTFLGQIVTWSPPSNSDDLWTTGANWTGGVAPATVDQDFEAWFSGAGSAILDSSVVVARTIVGRSDEAGESALILANGANLTSGRLSSGGTEWTAVGYSGEGRVVVEDGASLFTDSHLWLGFTNTGVGRLIIDGGTVEVSEQLGLGWDGGTGIVELLSGELILDRLDSTQSISGTSRINIEGGRVILDGDYESVINAYITADKIKGYDGNSTVTVNYDGGTDKTTVTAEPYSFEGWADDWGVDIGSRAADYDKDDITNFQEYVFGGDPTSMGDPGVLPLATVNSSSIGLTYRMRNDDPTLSYVLEGRADMSEGDWAPVTPSSEGSQAVQNRPELTEMNMIVDTTGEDSYFLRLNTSKVASTAPNPGNGGGGGGGDTDGPSGGGNAGPGVSASSISSLPMDSNQSDRVEGGPMVGHTTGTSARIWVEPKGGSNNNLNIKVYYVRDGEDMAYPFVMSKEETDDYSYRAEMDALYPDKVYDYYVVQNDNELLGTGRFRTAPVEGQPVEFSFGFTSCARWTDDPDQIGWNHMDGENLDFAMNLGDTIYTNATTNLGDFRRSYRQNKMVASFANLAKDLPIYTCWDDHDFGGNNGAGLRSRNGIPGTTLRVVTLNAFKEAWANPYEASEEGNYYSFSWGDVDFFVLDNRYHRTANWGQESSKMFGDDQMDWLKAKLLASTAPFKIICQGGGYDGGESNGEGFVAYPTEFQDFRSFVINNSIDGIVHLSGDIHRNELRLATSGNKDMGDYPLYNITASGIGQSSKRDLWVKMDIDTTIADPTLTMTFYQDGVPTQTNPSDKDFILSVTTYTIKQSDLQND